MVIAHLNLNNVNTWRKNPMGPQKIAWLVCVILAVISIFAPLPGGTIAWAALAIALK